MTDNDDMTDNDLFITFNHPHFGTIMWEPDGIFLETLKSAKSDSSRERIKRGFAEPVQSFIGTYGVCLVLGDEGLERFGVVADAIDGVMAESVKLLDQLREQQDNSD